MTELIFQLVRVNSVMLIKIIGKLLVRRAFYQQFRGMPMFSNLGVASLIKQGELLKIMSLFSKDIDLHTIETELLHNSITICNIPKLGVCNITKQRTGRN